MEITLKNLGLISEAQFTVGDLTVICGKNNTGKTYITYATYGFLDYWQHSNDLVVENDLVDKLVKHDIQDLPIRNLSTIANKILGKATNGFHGKLKRFFASTQEVESKSFINVNCDEPPFPIESIISSVYYTDIGNQISTQIQRGSTGGFIDINLQSWHPQIDVYDLQDIALSLNEVIKNWAFSNVIPKAFMASSERTGAALFQREVDFTRSRLIDLLKETNINPQQLLGRFTAEYPLPVKHNIDFIRDLPNIVRKQSEFSQQYPEILQAFADIAGGGYDINHVGGITYSPASQPDLKLSLAESSSTVRSLVDIGFYLRHLAQKGDLLMIDEPELNLHPENQRKIARLFAMLVNAGLRVFITTHSDYIIKEFNTLLLLNKPDERLRTLAHREGYQATELLKPEQLNVYMTAPDKNVIDKACYTLVPAKVTADSGIELTSFDETIEDINRIQDEIVWG